MNPKPLPAYRRLTPELRQRLLLRPTQESLGPLAWWFSGLLSFGWIWVAGSLSTYFIEVSFLLHHPAVLPCMPNCDLAGWIGFVVAGLPLLLIGLYRLKVLRPALSTPWPHWRHLRVAFVRSLPLLSFLWSLVFLLQLRSHHRLPGDENWLEIALNTGAGIYTLHLWRHLIRKPMSLQGVLVQMKSRMTKKVLLIMLCIFIVYCVLIAAFILYALNKAKIP